MVAPRTATVSASDLMTLRRCLAGCSIPLDPSALEQLRQSRACA